MVDLPKEIAMDVLARFLKAPVKTFCMTSLKLSFSDDNPTSEDNEPFLFNGLQHYQYCNDLLVALQENPAESMDIIFQQQFQRMAAKGSLPLAGFAKMAFNDLSSVVESAWNQYLTLNKAFFKKRILEAGSANLINNNEFKRAQSPIGPKITHRAFGKDRRYPVTFKH